MDALRYFVAGDGCRIAYRLDGDAGNPLLALSNSIATDHHMWDDQIDALTTRFRVLRYDTRGHGASDAPAGAYSLDRLGHDVLELLDSLRVPRTHFCGLSLGGFVAQWLGIHAPERIDRLVLSNTAPYLGPAPQWDELIRRVRDERDMAAIADMFVGNWFAAETVRERRGVVDAFRRAAAATSPDGLAGCLAVVRDADVRRTIGLIDAPTLVIGGADDTVTLPEHSREIAAAIPGARLTILPGVHMLNVEQPDFTTAVIDFLSAARTA